MSCAALGLPVEETSADAYRRKYAAPYRHKGGRSKRVQAMAASVGRVMGAAASITKRVAPELYAGMWAPIIAAPDIAPITLYPTPAMQQGRSGDEWAERDRLPLADEAAIPTGHLAGRVSGIPDNPSPWRILQAWRGISNIHTDIVDSFRPLSGVPIIYVSKISPAARRNKRYKVGASPLPPSRHRSLPQPTALSLNHLLTPAPHTHPSQPSHPLPSSDLIWSENDCRGAAGGRTLRIVTCLDGWACIAFAHYESQLHGGCMPAKSDGVVDRATGRPYLEHELVPGEEVSE